MQEALLRRNGLASNPAVIEAVRKVCWGSVRGPVCATSRVQSCVRVAVAPQHFDLLTGHKPPGRRWVTQDQYIRYFLMAYSVLNSDGEATEAELREQLMKEWAADSEGLPALTFRTFFKAVFELIGA